jgi:predicted nucleic acid-binding protein
VATTERLYVDPSALARVYFKQEGSREMAAWRWRNPAPLAVTRHGRCELVNAIGLAVFRGDLAELDGAKAFLDLDSDFSSGHLVETDVTWRAALKRAAELSRTYSPKFGTRSLDVLHVSCALELDFKTLLTFDEKQRKLADAVGLKTITAS